MAECYLRLRYPRRALVFDYFSTLLGLVFTVTQLTLVTPLAAVSGVLACLAMLFFLFGLRTVIRHNTFVAISDHSVTLGGLRVTDITWSELRELKLSNFSTRRGRQGGWMQLRLRGKGQTIRVDSTLEGFDKLVAHAAKEARRNELNIMPETMQGIIALGLAETLIELSSEEPAEEQWPKGSLPCCLNKSSLKQ